MDELAGSTGDEGRIRSWPTVVGFGVVFGIISGGLIGVIAAYHLLVCDDPAMLAFGPLVLACWFIVGYWVGRRTVSLRNAVIASLLAVVLGAGIGAVVHMWLTNEYIDTAVACLSRGFASVSRADILDSELGGTVVSLIVLPLVGVVLGWFGGFLGVGSGAVKWAAEAELRAKAVRAMPDDYLAEGGSRNRRKGARPAAPDVIIQPPHQVITNEVMRTDDPLAP